MEIIKDEKLNMININQGYSNCSIAVIDENSAIVTDKKIADILKKNNIDVLLIEDKIDIKLLKIIMSILICQDLLGDVLQDLMIRL